MDNIPAVVINYHREIIPALLTDSRAETLFKGGRIADLRHFLINPHGIDQYWAAYKITLRKHYLITDIALWCDYVDMLKRLGKDAHSPKYVCPENLQEAHDMAQRKLQAQQDKEAEARRRQQAIENEERFQELKAPFFGITFTDGVIQVKVLESVQEYLEEGKALHHCVFTNEYYLKEQSLIPIGKNRWQENRNDRGISRNNESHPVPWLAEQKHRVSRPHHRLSKSQHPPNTEPSSLSPTNRNPEAIYHRFGISIFDLKLSR